METQSGTSANFQGPSKDNSQVIDIPSPSTGAEQQSQSTDTKQNFISPRVSSYFIAGGIAGAASRTVVSPLERLKIIQQVQPRTSDQQYKGVWRSLVRMWKEEGIRGYMRGNGINCLRIVPYSAVQFTTYEQLKQWLTRNGTRELDTPKRLASGAMAGVVSVCSTYPLDIVRSRLSIATASLQATPTRVSVAVPSACTVSTASSLTVSTPALVRASHSNATHTTYYNPADLTMWGMAMKIVREEGGVRALYRGLVPTIMGVAPYVGANFATYEALRGVITPPGRNSAWRKLLCGALAGSISQTLTYPFDVLRRKMQVSGMKSEYLGIRYNGALDALFSIVRTEGVAGLYRGLWPNLLKVAPSVATSFFTYEVKEFLISNP
ncbi:mitochondrial carrier [Fistulina hepatica ATCC 64428]|uniref:Mitochondrial carrier n=1 Tax=Fistulina hepatica ATCC 64428 TaxID=1128425 RepID=A0A0D7A3J9_9AGAR|nr:mitochondrial carrier [Fistulina hepatica ATCC 64428]